MKSLGFRSAALAAVLLAPPADPVRAGDLGPLEPLADFHRAVHEALGLPEPLIVRLLEAGTPDEDLPVVGFLARELGRAPEEIADLHRGGLDFLDIALRFGKGPEIFYVPFDRDPGPPYGKAWGYYKKTPRARWRTIRLRDVEVVDLVNLRMARDYYGVAADRVAHLRGSGKDFGSIHRELSAETGKGHHRDAIRHDHMEHEGRSMGHGKGKNPDRDKGKGRSKKHGRGRLPFAPLG